MTPIETYVFMDLTTERNEVKNLTRITHMSLLAEHRSQYQETDDSKVAPEESTFQLFRKLNSDDDQPSFDMTTFYDFISFINGAETPVCVISHNEGDFNFPVHELQEQLQEFNVSLPNNITWANSFNAFCYILENKNWKPHINPSPSNIKGSSAKASNLQEDAGSNKLKDIYEQVVTNPYKHVHSSDSNNKMMYKISQVFGRFFVTWVDQNQRPLMKLKAEEIIIKSNKKADHDNRRLAKLGIRTILQPSSTSLC